jgi:hemoglobin
MRVKARAGRAPILAPMNQTSPSPATPYQLIGGEAGVQRLVEAFYDVMEREPRFARLRAIHAPDLAVMRARLADFLTGWMGGPRVYAERHPDRPCIVSAHAALPIDGQMASDWMAAMRQAFTATGVTGPLRTMLEPAFDAMCEGLRTDFGAAAQA